MIDPGLRGVIVVTALTNQKEHRQHNEPIKLELQVADSKRGKTITNKLRLGLERSGASFFNPIV